MKSAEEFALLLNDTAVTDLLEEEATEVLVLKEGTRQDAAKV